MHIFGHGVDVVKVASIREQLSCSTKNWANGVYSQDERAQADPPPVDSRYYAGRFAGKEAVAKALGTGFSGDITWRTIEILRGETGAPFVRLSAETLAFAKERGITGWLVSISHCEGLAIASAIAFGE